MDKNRQHEVTRMRYSPTKILQGLLCTTPILLLTLAACGGGGGTDAPLDVSYTVSGTITGLNNGGLTLLNNGGDAQTPASSAPGFSFPAITTGYNVTVLHHPDTPNPQHCTVTNGSGGKQAVNVSNVTVACENAYTIGGTFTGNTLGTGLVLQNNGGDNLLVPASAVSFVFTAPVGASSPGYNVSVLTQPNTPAQTCTTDATASGVAAANVSSVVINCTTNASLPTADPYVYVANFGSSGTGGVYPYNSTNGVLSAGTAATTGSAPSSIAVSAGFAYVTNYSSNTISAYSITAGALFAIDADSSITGTQANIATGAQPYAITIDPSGKFAYVANYGSNSVSAYSIDASTGALARIDSDKVTTGNQTSIPARSGPRSIAIDPSGGFAYVANYNDDSVSVYSIDTTTGALTAIDADGIGSGVPYIPTGAGPWSVTVGPAGAYLYVTNRAATGNTVNVFAIGNAGAGTLSLSGTTSTGANTTPVSIAIHPSGNYTYVVNYGTDKVQLYDSSTLGSLTYINQWSTGVQPSAIRIDSTGQYAYVTNYGDNSVSAYAVSQIDGSLTPVLGSPFPSGTGPFAVTTAR